MALAVDRETLTKTLWPPRAKAEAPLQVDGQLLRIHAARPHDTNFTCATVSPTNESCYALGTSDGSVYGLSLRENALFLVARTGLPVRCISFCGGVAFQTLALALEGNAIVFCDWGTGRVLQRFQVNAHERAITSIVVSPVVPTLTLFLSADKITCWTPVATSMDTSNYQYTCIGGTSPSQILYTLHPAPDAAQGVPGPSPAHSTRGSSAEMPRFLAVHLLEAYLLTTETNGVVALWSHERRSRLSGGSAALHEMTQLQCALRTADDFVIQCSAANVNLLALGGRHAPVVAFIGHGQHPTFTLESLLLVRVAEPLPASRTRHRDAAATAIGVLQLAFVGTELLAALLTNNRLVFVATRTRTVAFDIAFPQPDRGLPQGRSGAHVPAEAQSAASLSPASRLAGSDAMLGAQPQLCLHGSTFALIQGDTDVYVYYLPAARDYFRQRSFYNGIAAASAASGEADVNDARAGVLSSSSPLCDATELHTVKVAPFLRQPGPKSGTVPGSEGRSSATDIRDVDAQRRRQRAAARRAALCSGREPPQDIGERTTRTWVDANATEDAGHALGSMATRTAAAARRRQLQQTTNALYGDVLSPQALQYNMEKLCEYVQQYGLFPSTFRPVIWRFALGLPDVHTTAPQYATLARRPLHVCVEEVMERFPFPAGAMRRLVEKVVSNLAWHSPVLAMGHFLPALIYPLCHVYPQDPQRVTEAALSLLNNWFRDYFSHYPSRPAHLVTFLAHVLQKTDPELFQHLDTIGAGGDTWCWSLMKSFYTDVLSSAEWLQVMDHALMLQPMWLFHFHVCLVVALREPLLRCRSATEVQTQVLQSPHPQTIRVPDVIAAACRAYHTHKSHAAAVRTYYTFRDFGPLFEYPVDFPCDMDVVREKILHLDELAHVRAIQQDADAQLARDRAAEEEAHLNQEMALEAQRVRMAAKYDASAEVWRRRVLLEKTREGLEAKQRALHVQSVDDAVHHAEALRQVENETADLYRQLGHARLDQGREEYKWDLAARLTDQELTRLENAAHAHVARSLQRLAEAEENQGRAFDTFFARPNSDGDGDVDAAPSAATGASHANGSSLSGPARATLNVEGLLDSAERDSELLAQPSAHEAPQRESAASSALGPPLNRENTVQPASLVRNDSPPRANMPTTREIPCFIHPSQHIPNEPAGEARDTPSYSGSSDGSSPAPAASAVPFQTHADVPTQRAWAPSGATAHAGTPQTAAPTESATQRLRVRTPPAELLAPYKPSPAAAMASAQLAAGRKTVATPHGSPPSALQQLYERMKRAAAASVTTSSSAGSSLDRHSASRDREAAMMRTSAAPFAALHDNLRDGEADDTGRFGHQDPHQRRDSHGSVGRSSLATTSLDSTLPVTHPSEHTDSSYSVGQILERRRQRNVREYTY